MSVPSSGGGHRRKRSKDAQRDARDRHHDRGAEQQRKREFLVLGQLDAAQADDEESRGRQRLTGNPVVICPKRSLPDLHGRHAELAGHFRITGSTPK